MELFFIKAGTFSYIIHLFWNFFFNLKQYFENSGFFWNLLYLHVELFYMKMDVIFIDL
jgi:hypothetical protein